MKVGNNQYTHLVLWLYLYVFGSRGVGGAEVRQRIKTIIIIIIIISFMQGIYTHIPETNYVPREYSVAAILLLLFVSLSVQSIVLLH